MGVPSEKAIKAAACAAEDLDAVFKILEREPGDITAQCMTDLLRCQRALNEITQLLRDGGCP